MKKDPVGPIVAAVLATAVLSTLLVKDGWLLWPPVLSALAVAYALGIIFRR